MTARETPDHGTVLQYRIELAAQKSGTGEGPCRKCRAANAERARNARANSAARARRAQMSIVDDAPESEQEPAQKSTSDRKRRIGAMEQAVQADIDEIDPALHVPFHRSLSVLALELAEEIDEPATAATARRDARKQLFEVLRSLRTQKEGDDASALDLLLDQAGFGVPLVSGRAT